MLVLRKVLCGNDTAILSLNVLLQAYETRDLLLFAVFELTSQQTAAYCHSQHWFTYCDGLTGWIRSTFYPLTPISHAHPVPWSLPSLPPQKLQIHGAAHCDYCVNGLQLYVQQCKFRL